MKQIKFRAWNGSYMIDASYGDWISFDGVAYTEADKKYNTPHIEIEKAKNYVLMQFTGLLDCKGKEIYEGDVLLDKLTGAKLEVCFGRNIYMAYNGWYCKYLNADVKDTALNGDYDTQTNSQIEVVGNIYENENNS